MSLSAEQLNFKLSDWTSWHIGGHAERFMMPSSLTQLEDYLQALPADLPITWLGLGSNVLIRDGGIPGSVICTQALDKLYETPDGAIVAQAGVTCAKLARFACKLGYPDAGFFAGIPGTVGGALRMNAGAFGSETWPWVESLQMIARNGILTIRSPKDFDIAYRHVHNKMHNEEAFIAASFRFEKKPTINGLEKIKDLLRQRKMTQPIGSFNCGSVYRNPPGDFAARLIEGCGLKGFQQGDAQISQKHANFIINLGHATAKDVEHLMQTIENAVQSKFGITLHPEVKILGVRGPGEKS